ncbi:hypothetical protein K9N68_17430 [Kovacikia minuta CCNUW1]|uniref:slr1659 superfamily regulator n=1 Tax=Kovacikia minuta TaxID=2931930 RepID=UPI001CCFDA4C|nr:hypothetical protein [Kovacikia minuta]UBF23571.1 hypothetical protein K9N68_17430 [Kovacikia minuta CCNUW1]
MEIKTKDYQIQYDPATTTVTCLGLLRLSGLEEYAPIVKLLDEVAVQAPPKMVLNLRELQFLNSSGIIMLSRFILKVRDHENTHLVVQGSKDILWQKKSLKNLRRLMPNLQLEFE